MKILEPAIRQYRHNNDDNFVIGYDREETEKIVAKLIQQINYLTECDERAHKLADYWYDKYEELIRGGNK